MFFRILLPPSETKRKSEGESADCALNPAELAFAAELGPAREIVVESLCELSEDEERAACVLKLGPRARNELEHNRQLRSAATLAAIDRYTGVLYDALAYRDRNAAEEEWILQHVYIQSALFGTISAKDKIPAYRLSASSALPLGDRYAGTFKRLWQEAHENIVFPNTLLLDMRSKDYISLAPYSDAIQVEVLRREANGNLRQLNHFNKHTKGLFVRVCAQYFAQNTVQNNLEDSASRSASHSAGNPTENPTENPQQNSTQHPTPNLASMPAPYLDKSVNHREIQNLTELVSLLQNPLAEYNIEIHANETKKLLTLINTAQKLG